MKKVVLSQRVDFISDRNESRDSLDQRLIDLLLFADLLPIPVPNALGGRFNNNKQEKHWFDVWIEAVDPQGVVLSGGNDIQEFPGRYQVEYWLLEYAKQRSLPLLGICRGMQMIGTYAGVKLKAVAGHVRTRHQLSHGFSGEANSFHRFSLNECPSNFCVLARSEDGEIEAIRHDFLPWQGWMWHPERELNYSSRDVKQIRELFK